MLDIRYIREHPDEVQKKSEQKGYKVDILKLLELDKQRRLLMSQIEDFQRERKQLTAQLNAKPTETVVQKGRELKEKQFRVEEGFIDTDQKMLELWKAVPNMPADDVPVGASEAENVVSKEWGDKPQFDFEPKTHWQIGESRGWIDKEKAAKVTGSRFAYLKGDLVKLQFAIIQFALETLGSKETLQKIAKDAGLKVSDNPFVPTLPPAMVRTEIYEEMDRLEPREERYKVGADEDNLWLQGSAEHTLGPMYKDEVIDSFVLPLRFAGYLTSFRREAGTYGKDTEGIIRMHQFDKLEMESFTKSEDGPTEHLFLVAIQEYLMQQLELPYRVIQKCTADIGKPNARGIDIEVWLPGNERYLETHTADYMSDYQARRLKTRVKIRPEEADRGLIETGSSGAYNSEDVRIEFAHTNDATAFAMGRTLVAIIENYQNQDNTIRIPEALQPYMQDKTQL